jgi:23S rRNA (cytosine1962-C5)-methyltransferase
MNWTDYQLIDSGGQEKLERFGKYLLARPEPQAVWSKSLSDDEWEKRASGWYHRSKGQGSPGFRTGENDPAGKQTEQIAEGRWSINPGMAEQWIIQYPLGDGQIKFRLGLTSFGHIGIFPEQASNWEYIYEAVKQAKYRESNQSRQVGKWSGGAAGAERIRVLNLFAYTGGASLAAKAAGADVVHVDSVKPVINWAKENMELSGMRDIRWVVEDALKFVMREANRRNLYHGIILDPPAYGRGPKGEKWILEEGVDELVHLCSSILYPEDSFIVFSLYSLGYSALISENLIKTHFRDPENIESGELYFSDQAGRKLPLGTFLRMSR